MSTVVELNGTSWAAIVFALATFLIVGVCIVFIFACCKACRKERQRQLVSHVISEAESQPPLDKPPSYWRFFRSLSSIKLSQALQVGDNNAYSNQVFSGTPPPKYDGLAFIFDFAPKDKVAKCPSVNEEDQGITFTARSCPPTILDPDMHETIIAKATHPSSSEGSPVIPPKNLQSDLVWPTLDSGDVTNTSGNSSMCLERSFLELVSKTLSPGGEISQQYSSEVLDDDADAYNTRL